MVQTTWIILSGLLMVCHIEGKAVASPNPDPKPNANPEPKPEATPDLSHCGGAINPWLTQNRISNCGGGLIDGSSPTYLGSYGLGSQAPSYYGGGFSGFGTQSGLTPYIGGTGFSGTYPPYSSSYPSYSSSYPSHYSSYPSYSGSAGHSGSFSSSYPYGSSGLTYPGQSF